MLERTTAISTVTVAETRTAEDNYSTTEDNRRGACTVIKDCAQKEICLSTLKITTVHSRNIILRHYAPTYDVRRTGKLGHCGPRIIRTLIRLTFEGAELCNKTVS